MINKNTSAVILVGGDSLRMGIDKNFIPLNGENMLERVISSIYDLFQEIVIVANTPDKFKMFAQYDKIKLSQDKMIHLKKSSLRGIYAGLGEISNQYGFVIAGDMPFIEPGLVNAMLAQIQKRADGIYNWDIVIPTIQGHYEPLFALYNVNCRKLMEAYLIAHQYKILNLLSDCNILEISENFCKSYDQDLMSFFNVNTPEQLQIARSYFQQYYS